MMEFSIYIFSTISYLVIVPVFSEELLLLTVATNRTDGYERYLRSTKVYGLDSKTLGLGEKWTGGDVINYPGGGQKINIMKEEVENLKDRDDLIILFADSYDVILTSGSEKILEDFKSFNAKVVFAAEDFCWPDKSLKEKYPKVIHGYKYLNSGGFIGYAPVIYKILTQVEINDWDDDQLYYTNVFLNKHDELGIKLDSQAKIFQNLNGNSGDVSLDFEEFDTKLMNTVYQTKPSVIHGNGPTKILLNSLGNYLAKSWISKDGCNSCTEKRINMAEMSENDYPKVLIGVFISKPTPFLDAMLQKVSSLNYPKEKIILFIYNQETTHESVVRSWLDNHGKGYISVKSIRKKDKIKEWHARNLAVEKSVEEDCDIFFNIDSDVHLDNPESLNLLISYNRPILAPIIARVGKAWSTFWGAITDEGYYARSADYMDIVNYARTGIWNVPYISGCYVIWKSVLTNPQTRPNYIHKLLDTDMALATNFRENGVFMYAINLERFGHLVNAEAVSTKHLHNDLWQVATNVYDWQQRYIHPGYLDAIDPEKKNIQPCPDVYWFPLFTDRFCKEMIETMEHFGEWSGSSNKDGRLTGGYENVPTNDIHMTQVEYNQEFLYILKTYVKPIAEKIYDGYSGDSRALLSFVVKYNPEQQYFLRPHHDSSTYTINVGLNKPKLDYEGGGAHFIRYNCSVTNTKVGWALIHPGRLTHYHEGLPTVKGTRYILVSFVDP